MGDDRLPIEREPISVFVEASFFADWDEASWRALIESLGMEASAVDWAPWFSKATALPADLIPQEKVLTIEVHPLVATPRRTHWVLTFEPVRGPVPAARISKSSERVGGREGLLLGLEEKWGASKELRGSLKTRFVIDARAWGSGLFPKVPAGVNIRKDLRASAKDALLDWQLQLPQGETRIAIFSQGGSPVHVATVEWEGRIELSSKLALDLEQQAWARLEVTLKRKRVSRYA